MPLGIIIMKKRTVLFSCDLNAVTHMPAFWEDLSYEEICAKDIFFCDSEHLKEFYAREDIGAIFIMLFVLKDSKELRRRIGAVSEKNPSEIFMKNMMSEMMASVGVKADFHSPDEFKKIIPMDDENRAFLKVFWASL